MSAPRTRLDQEMTERGLQLQKRWVKIAQEAGITTSALSGIRRDQYRPSAHTARAIEDALEWEHGSIEAILAGGEPTPIEQRALTDSATATEDLTAGRQGEDATDAMLDALLDRIERNPRLRERARRILGAEGDRTAGDDEAGETGRAAG